MVKVGKWYNRPELVYVYKIDPQAERVYFMECILTTVSSYSCSMQDTKKWEETEYDVEQTDQLQRAVNAFAKQAQDCHKMIDDYKNALSKANTEIDKLNNEIRELKHGKFTVLIVDQWTSTGNVEEFSLADFQAENVHGGDSDTVRAVGVASYKIREVFGNERPAIGEVWFIEEDGKLKKWKYNYDTSD